MKSEALLPVGSVVMLKQGNHRLMIIGYCQRLLSEPDQVYDYVGCLFPEGFLDAERNYLFNREQIAEVCHEGCRTEGQAAFTEKMEEAIAGFRAAQNGTN